MSKIKNGGLDQYGAEPFELQQFGTAGVQGVRLTSVAIVAKASSLHPSSLHAVPSVCFPPNCNNQTVLRHRAKFHTASPNATDWLRGHCQGERRRKHIDRSTRTLASCENGFQRRRLPTLASKYRATSKTPNRLNPSSSSTAARFGGWTAYALLQW